MAFEEQLATRIRELIGADARLSEAKVFGGLAFLINGNMAISASGNGGIVVRVDPEASEDLIATSPARMMEMRGRTMKGWLRIDSAAVEADEALASWVEIGVAYAGSLPAKSS